ncbi:MAG: EAL domain-containing protein [Methylovulum sp.]|nr:EAL domain-containing protein [Methylovulum sp.]
MSPLLTYRWPYLPKLLGVAVAYALLVKIVLIHLTTDASNISIVWMPSGLGLATLLIGGKKYWPGILLGSLAVRLMLGGALLPSTFAALSNVVEPLLGVWLLDHVLIKADYRFDSSLTQPRDYFALALTATLTAMVAAIIGVTSFWLAGIVTTEVLEDSFLHWWMGNVLGMTLLAPLILVWQTFPHHWLKWHKAIEALFCFGLMLLMGQALFLSPFNELNSKLALGYWPFLFVVWAAVRLGRHGTLLIIFITATQALLGAIQGIGFFAGDLANTSLYGFWSYMLVLTLVGLTLALVINQRDQAENHLRTLSVAVEQSPAAIIITDLNATIQYTNPRFTQITGYSAAETLGYNFSFFYPELTDPADYRAMQNALANGLAWSGECANRHKNGSIYWEEVYMAPVNNKKGTTTHYVAVQLDITERKQAELLLRSSEQHYATLLNVSPVGVFETNKEGLCLYVNGRWSNITGLPPEQAAGTGWITALYPDDKQAVCSEWENAIAEARPFRLEYRFLRDDGKITWVLGQAQAFYTQSGEVQGYIGTITDITEQKLTEQREQSHSQMLDLLAKGAPLNEILHAVVANIEQNNPAMLCSILLMDQEGRHLLLGAGPSLPDFFNAAIDGVECGEGVGSCGTCAFSGQRVIVEDIQSHPYWAAYKDLAAEAGLAACWSEPIKNTAGKVIGSFAIYQRQVSTPDEADIRLIIQAATIAGIAIEQSHARNEQKIASLVYQNTSEAMIVTDVNNTIIAVNPAFIKVTGYTADEIIGKNPRILQSGKHDKAFYDNLWHALNTVGRWQGELWDKRKNGEIYPKWLTIDSILNKDGILQGYLALFSDISLFKKAEDLIWQQANYDSLTGLPNRRMFNDRLNQEIKKAHRTKSGLALMFLDLDRFKEINDSLGHAMGDKLLSEAARRLRECVREVDTVARLGGDEFVIILTGIGEPEAIDGVAKNILAVLAQPFWLDNETAYISASIGIALYPEDAHDVVSLIKSADQAMYDAKEKGRNCYSYFAPFMQEAARIRVQMTKDLRSAIAGQQFFMLYQPIVSLKTGNVHKAEALIRWTHPVYGVLNPEVFIAIAEENRMIIEIGDWVFREVARQAAKWRSSLYDQFQISVNKSPIQFQSLPYAHGEWIAYLQELGIPGQSIVIEITEGLLLNANVDTINQLLAYRDAGINVSLDDFGTGYSSLAYLRKFDIDYLKIDQTFIRHLTTDSNDFILCEAIIVMAHKLGIKVIAEGIETTEQRDLLTAMGCDYGQGYLFSKPLAPIEFETLFNTH